MKKIGLLLTLFLVLGCKKAEDALAAETDSPQSVSESAATEAGAQATSSEGASSPFMAASLSEDFQAMDYVDPQSYNVQPYAACSFAANRSTCTSNVSTIAWNGCTIGLATATGGWTETWSAGFCANSTSPGILTNGTNVTRVTTGTGEILTTSIGATLTTSTTAHNAYDNTAIGSGITISNTTGTRTILISGIRKTLVGPRGTTLFDHSIKASPGLSVTGTRTGANRVVSGNSTMYHNLASYTAAHTFNAVTWGSATCCYPTSGTVTTTLTGSKAGSISLNFAPGATTCGQATFTDTAGATSTVTLNQCH